MGALLKIKKSNGTIASVPVISGSDGNDGKSAYELAVDYGYTGTEADFVQGLIAAANLGNSIGVLPPVTSSDNGKIAMVVNGAWSAENLPYANSNTTGFGT